MDSRNISSQTSGRGATTSSAECNSPASGKRATGSLRVKLTFSIRLPRGCTSRACQNAELRKLYIKAVQVQNLIRRNKASVSVTNKNTNRSETVPLTGSLKPQRPRLACSKGTVYRNKVCGKFNNIYYVWTIWLCIEFIYIMINRLLC